MAPPGRRLSASNSPSISTERKFRHPAHARGVADAVSATPRRGPYFYLASALNRGCRRRLSTSGRALGMPRRSARTAINWSSLWHYTRLDFTTRTSRYYDMFQRKQIKVPYEDPKDPVGTLRDIYGFWRGGRSSQTCPGNTTCLASLRMKRCTLCTRCFKPHPVNRFAVFAQAVSPAFETRTDALRSQLGQAALSRGGAAPVDRGAVEDILKAGFIRRTFQRGCGSQAAKMPEGPWPTNAFIREGQGGGQREWSWPPVRRASASGTQSMRMVAGAVGLGAGGRTGRASKPPLRVLRD